MVANLRKSNNLGCAIGSPPSFLTFHRLEHLETAHQRLIDGHHRAGIVELSTIVGCTEDGDELSLGKELVTIFYDLVCANNEVHVLLLQEAAHHIWAKDERD